MPRRPPTPEHMLSISRICAEAFIEAGGPGVPIAQLASLAGISERTFYRYFPTKEECLRPLLADGTRAFAHDITAIPREIPLSEAIPIAIERTLMQSSDAFSAGVMRLIVADPPFRRVWLEEIYETVPLLMPALAHRLRVDASDPLTLAAATLASQYFLAVLRQMTERSVPASEALDNVRVALAELTRRWNTVPA